MRKWTQNDAVNGAVWLFISANGFPIRTGRWAMASAILTIKASVDYGLLA